MQRIEGKGPRGMKSRTDFTAEEGRARRRPEGVLTFLKTTWVAILSVFFLLLTGCAVGPDYHPPKSTLPNAWSSPHSGGLTNKPASEVDWWMAFHDAELD